MSFLTTTPTYDSVYQLESTDDVQGGAGGISNRQAQQLGDRDDYLLNLINTGLLSNAVNAHGPVSPTAADSGTLYINNSPSFAQFLYLPDITTVPTGYTVGCYCGNNAIVPQCFVNTFPADAIDNINLYAPTQFYPVYDGGVVFKKVAGSANWVVLLRWGTVEAGTICVFPIGGNGNGWCPCVGGSQPVVSYPELFQKINYSYGGSGSTFNAPTIPDPSAGFRYYIHV